MLKGDSGLPISGNVWETRIFAYITKRKFQGLPLQLKTRFGHILHRPRLNGPLTPLVFGHCCVLGHVLRLTTLIPAGWTGWPPFAPLAHPDVIVAHTRTNRVCMDDPFRSFGTCGLSLDTTVRRATSLKVAHTAASEDKTACTPQPCLQTWLLYERCLILRHMRPRFRT